MSRISKNLGWCSLQKTPAKAKLQLFFFQTPQNSQPQPPPQPTNQRTNRPSDIVLAVLESQASIPKRTLQCLGSRRMAMAASHGKCEADEKFHMSRFVILFRMNLSYVWRIFNCFLCFNSCSKDLLLYGFLVEYVEVEVEMDSISDVSFWAPLVPIAHEIIAMMLTMMVATMNAEMMVPNV